MLENVDLHLKLTKKEYKERFNQISESLTLNQRACWENGIPIIILFEGWDASGKGTSINLLAQQFDPRGFRIHPIKGATDQEKRMPWLWRFWLRLPNYGEIAIFDRSWYGRVLIERVEKIAKEAAWKEAYQDILDFERTLFEDGYIIIKFFLHISKKEQMKRFEAIDKDPLQSWRVQKEDWKHHKKYKEYLVATEDMLARTETEWGNWTIVEATDQYWARIKILETVEKKLEIALNGRKKPEPVASNEIVQTVPAMENAAASSVNVKTRTSSRKRKTPISPASENEPLSPLEGKA